MSKSLYTDEFKAEAVKQITERGYPANEVAKNLGVTTCSLYKWVEKYSSAKDTKKKQVGKRITKRNP